MAAPWEKYQSEQSKPWEKYAQAEAQEPILNRVGSSVLNGISKASDFVDKYSGAPVREGIGALQSGKGLLGAVRSGMDQFGADPHSAPSGKEIAQKAGIPDTALSSVIPGAYSKEGIDPVKLAMSLATRGRVSPGQLKPQAGGLLDPTASGAAGLGISMASDPTSYIPGKAIGGLAKLGVEGAAAIKNPVVKAASGLLSRAGNLGNAAFAKVGSELSGVPKDAVRAYIDRTHHIDKISKNFGGSIPMAADDLRKEIFADMLASKEAANKQISKALETSDKGKAIDVTHIINDLETQAGRVGGADPESANQLSSLISSLKGSAKNESNLFSGQAKYSASPQKLYEILTKLNKETAGSYVKGGQLFQVAKGAQGPAKRAAFKARAVIKKEVPEIAEANERLSKLHNLTSKDVVDRKLYTADTNENPLLMAGSNSKSRARMQLDRIGNLTGKDFSKRAEDLAAEKSFVDPSWVGAGAQTGVQNKRLFTGGALGGTAGYLMGGYPGMVIGGASGAALTSPAMLKKAIQAKTISQDLVKDILGPGAKLTDDNLKKLGAALSSPGAGSALKKGLLPTYGLLKEREKQDGR